MSYIRPDKVISPKNWWELDRVLYPGEEGTWAAAEGTWEGKKALAIRWNGRTGKELGQPQSSGYATWFIVPDELEDGIRDVITLLEKSQKNPV